MNSGAPTNDSVRNRLRAGVGRSKINVRGGTAEAPACGSVCVLRYILVFSILLLLGIGASAAASAAEAPAVGHIAFLVCLGLFAAALASGVADRRLHRPKARPVRRGR
jgi:hypothetical protein